MSVSCNFPHQLAVLLVAFQRDKLPICEIITDPGEKSLFATLMTYMDSKDFTTPITISRKTLGTAIRVKRATLFTKLKGLKELGLIEDTTGEKPIRLTKKAVDLLKTEWTKQPKAVENSATEKTKMFKVGSSTFPKEIIHLLNRGLSESDLKALLCEAKKAGTTIQNVMKDFTQIFHKYTNKSLFLVVRDIIRNPSKYIKKDFSTEEIAKLPTECDQLLHEVHERPWVFLESGQHVSKIDGVWWFFEDGARKGRVTLEQCKVMSTKARTVVLAYAEANPDWGIKVAGTDQEAGIDLSHTENPQYAQLLISNKQLQAPWFKLLLAIPEMAIGAHAPFQKHEREGMTLMRKGIRYFVESIAGSIAMLRVLGGPKDGLSCRLNVADLVDPSISWLSE